MGQEAQSLSTDFYAASNKIHWTLDCGQKWSFAKPTNWINLTSSLDYFLSPFDYLQRCQLHFLFRKRNPWKGLGSKPDTNISRSEYWRLLTSDVMCWHESTVQLRQLLSPRRTGSGLLLASVSFIVHRERGNVNIVHEWCACAKSYLPQIHNPKPQLDWRETMPGKIDNSTPNCLQWPIALSFLANQDGGTGQNSFLICRGSLERFAGQHSVLLYVRGYLSLPSTLYYSSRDLKERKYTSCQRASISLHGSSLTKRM